LPVYYERDLRVFELVLRAQLREIDAVPVLEPLSEEVDRLVQVVLRLGHAGEEHVPASQRFHDAFLGACHEPLALHGAVVSAPIVRDLRPRVSAFPGAPAETAFSAIHLAWRVSSLAPWRASFAWISPFPFTRRVSPFTAFTPWSAFAWSVSFTAPSFTWRVSPFAIVGWPRVSLIRTCRASLTAFSLRSTFALGSSGASLPLVFPCNHD